MNKKMKKVTWPVKNSQKVILPIYLLYPQGNLFYIFHGLLFIIIIFPFLETAKEKQAPLLLTITNVVVILAIVFVVSINKRQIAVGLCLGIPTLILCWMHIPITQTITLVLTTFLYVYAILLLIPYLLNAEEIGSEEICGAITLYMLLGLTWATIFQEIELVYPGSFAYRNLLQSKTSLIWSDYLFYSFTTLTTLGYGDIVPIKSNARSLAIIESTTGVIFLTVIVARIIGLSISKGVCKIIRGMVSLK